MKRTTLRDRILLLAVAVILPISVFAELYMPDTPIADRTAFTELRIIWTPDADPDIFGYKVYRNGDLVATIPDPGGDSHSDTGLYPGNNYTYTIRSYDGFGNLSPESLPLELRTLEALTCDHAQEIMNIIDGLDPTGMTADGLITAVQNAFWNIGLDPALANIDRSLLIELIEERIQNINDNSGEPETPESRAADRAELDGLLLDHFGGHSFLSLFLYSNFTELAEKHFQNGKPGSALLLYGHSLNYLSDVEATVFSTLQRMAQIRRSFIAEDWTAQGKIEALHEIKDQMYCFFDNFPSSQSHFAIMTCTGIVLNYFRYFPELLDYNIYEPTVFSEALAAAETAVAIGEGNMLAERLERVSAWRLTLPQLSLMDSSGAPVTGAVTVDNVSSSRLYPEDAPADTRTFGISAANVQIPLYIGHNYDFTVSADVSGGVRRNLHFPDIPHLDGKKYTYDHHSGPIVTNLANSAAPAQFVFIIDQPDAPYNLAATRLVDTFTLSWDWTSPAEFDLDHFKVFRSGSELGAVTVQSMTGIPIDAGNNTFTYTVIAYDSGGAASAESEPLTVTPEFTPEQQAYYEWKLLHFGTDPMYDYDDPDGDGLSNYYEFLLGSDPNLAPVQNVKDTISDAVSGLFAEYFSFSGSMLPEFDSLNSISSEVISELWFSGNNGDILGSGLSDYVAVRLTGYLDVADDGLHRFYLNSDDGSKLFINGNLVIDNDRRHQPREYSVDTFLRAGVHSIELQYFEYTTSATLELAWAGPGFGRKLVDNTALWYTPNPTALLAESLAYNRDSDNDGIIDMIEYQLGTDPFNADSDGDGLTDYEEVYIYGTDPLSKDTDGDGFSDFDEIFYIFSDPLVADISDSVVEMAAVDGSAATIVSGEWETDGASVFALGRNGSLEYTIEVSMPGVYRMAVEVTENNELSTSSVFSLGLSVDDCYVANATVTAPYGSTADAYFYLPWLDTGTHSFKLIWNNVTGGSFLRVNALRLQALGGPDNDGNGIPDWIDKRLADAAELTVPPASTTSPVCIEGRNQLNIGNLLLSGYYTPPEETPVEPVLRHAPDNRWYSNVSLSPDSATVLSFDFRNGSDPEQRTVSWTETNILAIEDMQIRVGDSLLLTAFPADAVSGEVVITVGSEEFNLHYDTANPRNSVIHCFEDSGEFDITATYTPDGIGDPVSGTMSVNVVSSHFSSPPPVAVLGKIRKWDNPGIDPAAIISADRSLTLFESPLSPAGRKIDVKAVRDEPAYVLSRLGENGPVLHSATVDVIKVEFTPSRKAWVIETFADGSVMVQYYIALGNIPSDLRIYLRIFVSGHTFDDGTLERWVYASDFDEYGVYKYRIIRSPEASTGVCHHTKIYQGDELLSDQ